MSKSHLQSTGVSLERLQSLRSVCKNHSIMEAAKRDPNKQSLYSRQIKELETALSVSLLDRSATPAKPTNIAHKISALYTEFEEGLRSEIELYSEKETIRIGAGESILQWLVIPILSSITDTPHLKLELFNLQSSEILHRLKTGQLEIGITTRVNNDKSINTKRLTDLNLKLVASKTTFHTSPSTLDDLGERTLAALSSAPLPSHVSNQVKVRCSSYAQLLELAKHSNTASIVNELCIKSAKHLDLEVFDFPPLHDSTIQLNLAWNKSMRSPVVQEILHTLMAEK